MLFRNERILDKRMIGLIGEDVDDIILREFCIAFGQAMKDNNMVKVTNEPSHYLPIDDKLYKAEVHIFHSDQIQKIKEALHELFRLENFTPYDVTTRVREIAELLGFAEKIQNAAP